MKNAVRARFHAVVGAWQWFWGGGTVKYRVRGCRVEMKGGGTGPFWWFANFSDFDSPEQSEIFARRWAHADGGIYCTNAQREAGAVATSLHADVGLPTLHEMKPSAKGRFPVRDSEPPKRDISSDSVMRESMDSMPSEFFKPNATGESRAIARTLDPIVGNS